MTLDLDALEKLEQEATAGSWRVSPHATHYVDTTGERSDTVCKCYQDSPKRGEPVPDAALIAALRNAAPALIARARRADELEAEVKSLLELVERHEAARFP